MNKDIIQWIKDNKCKSCLYRTEFCKGGRIDEGCYDFYKNDAPSSIVLKEEPLKKQSRIVKERLSYHFASTQGGWSIEGMPPFMKEFLNEVNKLCDMTIEEGWNKEGNK